MKYFDWWPEDKFQPMIITGGGTLEYVGNGSGNGNPFNAVKDDPNFDLQLDQYYEPGAFAEAMTKPRIEVVRTEENRGSIIPRQHERPLLGVRMDRNLPCYVDTDTYYNMDLMQWWSHMVPVRWSEYFEKRRGNTKVPKAKCIGHPGDVNGRVSSLLLLLSPSTNLDRTLLTLLRAGPAVADLCTAQAALRNTTTVFQNLI